MGGRVIWLFSAIFLAYAGVCALMFIFQRNLQYVPERGAIVPADWGLPDFRTVTVTTADGVGIDLWHAPADGLTKPTVVLFHGNGGHMGHRADKALALRRAGYGVLLAGYRGYGPNAGSPTEQGLYADGRAALDFLVREGVSGQRVVLYGESLGSGIAVQLATERRVGAVILEAPFTSIPDAAAIHYPWLPVRGLIKDRYDSLSRIADIRAPLLIVHGEQDRVVPIRLGCALFAKAAEPKVGVWVPGAGHNDLMDHGLMRHILAFLRRQSGAVEPPTLEQERKAGTAIVPRP